MPSVHEIADYFILRSDHDAGDVMTHLKLEKLVYYAQGWHLALNKAPLFPERLEAWEHGPVCPELWQRFKNKKWNPILHAEILMDIEEAELDEEFLNEVWEEYGQYSAKWLENLTHGEGPWEAAFAKGKSGESNVIGQEEMKSFFEGLLADA